MSQIKEEKIEVFGMPTCPHVHAIRLVLREKQVEHTFTGVDPANKPDWFAKITPPGKMPVLHHQGIIIHNSRVIYEYLDGIYLAPKLIPDDPNIRANMYLWIDFCDSKLLPPAVSFVTANSEITRKKAGERLGELFVYLEKNLLAKLSGDGPYWLGRDISMLDIVFFTVIGRVKSLEANHGSGVPTSCTRLNKWYQVMKQQKSVLSLSGSND